MSVFSDSPEKRRTKLAFDAWKVREHVKHAREAEEHKPTYRQMCSSVMRHDGRRPGVSEVVSVDDVDQDVMVPALHLLNDHGIYLMTNGRGYSVSDRDEPPYDVVYAKGYGPDAPDNRLGRPLGGRDFARVVPMLWWERRRQEETFVIHAVTQDGHLKGLEPILDY